MRGSSARPSNATGRTKKPLNRSSTSSLNGSYLVMLAMSGLLSKTGAAKMGAEKKVSSPPSRMPADFRSQIEVQRAYLLRYASLQLRNPEAAEDAVQETLLAALAGEAGFRGQSNLRTWLTGILKHKIIDAIRKATRETAAGAFDEEPDIGEFGYQFKENDHWQQRPTAWSDPDSALEQKQFLAALEK